MFGNLGRRLIEAVVGLFALLGFAYVPLGSKTGLQHASAVLATRPVRDAVDGFASAVVDAKAKLVAAFLQRDASAAPLPLPAHTRHGHSVRPVVPSMPANASLAPADSVGVSASPNGEDRPK